MGLLSIPHLIIIFLVTLVIFGPQKLPELARQLGRALAEFRRATADLRGSFDEHMRELEREARTSEPRTLETAKPPEAAVPAIPETPPAAPAPTPSPTEDRPHTAKTP